MRAHASSVPPCSSAARGCVAPLLAGLRPRAARALAPSCARWPAASVARRRGAAAVLGVVPCLFLLRSPLVRRRRRSVRLRVGLLLGLRWRRRCRRGFGLGRSGGAGCSCRRLGRLWFGRLLCWAASGSSWRLRRRSWRRVRLRRSSLVRRRVGLGLSGCASSRRRVRLGCGGLCGVVAVGLRPSWRCWRGCPGRLAVLVGRCCRPERGGLRPPFFCALPQLW